MQSPCQKFDSFAELHFLSENRQKIPKNKGILQPIHFINTLHSMEKPYIGLYISAPKNARKFCPFFYIFCKFTMFDLHFL